MPVAPCISPLIIPPKMRIYLVTVVLSLQPLAINITKNINKTDIRILITCSSTETKNTVPNGIVSIIANIIGDISLKLHFFAPTKVK